MKQLLLFLTTWWIAACGGMDSSLGPAAPEKTVGATGTGTTTERIPVAKIVLKTVPVNGKTYYLDITTGGATAQIWLRVSPNACSIGDIKVMNLSASKTTLGRVKKDLCYVKNIYDNGRTVAGCSAVGIAGGCAVAAVATDGAAAAFCAVAFEPTLNYAYKRGAADCIDGLSDYIAGVLVGDRNWAAFETGASISEKQWKDAINSGIDTVCASAR